MPDISKWNTKKITNNFGIFSGCDSLKTLPDISICNNENIIDYMNNNGIMLDNTIFNNIMTMNFMDMNNMNSINNMNISNMYSMNNSNMYSMNNNNMIMNIMNNLENLNIYNIFMNGMKMNNNNNIKEE